MALRLSRYLPKLLENNHKGLIQLRNSSYQSSLFLEDVPKITTQYEITRNPIEWKYVERVLPLTIIPQPEKKTEYPSGWKPQGDNFENRPYFIARTKNHMMPVYLKIIRKIQGDIWQFEKDLRPFLEDLIKPKPVRLQVNEFAGMICMNGDHVNAIKWWLEQRNF